jgi:hypothetical protein
MASYVVDACIWIAAAYPGDRHHEIATQFLEVSKSRHDELFAPMTVLWDIGAALGDPAKRPPGAALASAFNSNIRVITIDEGLFHRTWDSTYVRIASKGPERIILSCALDLKLPLITLDGPLRSIAAHFGVKALTPEDYLSLLAPTLQI